MIAKRKKTKKSSQQDIFFSIFLLILAFLVIGFLVVSNWRMNKKRTELYSQIEQLQAQIQALEERKQELLSNISQGSEQDYLEKEAREKLGLKKPGEEVVVIKRTEQEKEAKPQQSFWQRLLDPVRNFFGGL